MNTPNKTDKKRLDTKWIIAAIVVPIVVAGIGYYAATRGNKQTAENKTEIINIGITLEEHDRSLQRQEKKLKKELSESIRKDEQEKRQTLEIELKAVVEKQGNLQQSYEEEKKRRESAVTALEKFKGELPVTKIEEAEKHLQSGDTKIAEKLFDEIDEKGSVSVALAAYQSGQLAEGRIDYGKAMKKYRRAVALENSNPDYLLAASTMARTLGDYKEAQPWLEKLLDVATTLGNLSGLYTQHGKYEEAEPLYKRSLGILRRTFPNGHPNIDVCESNYALLKKAMQSNQ